MALEYKDHVEIRETIAAMMQNAGFKSAYDDAYWLRYFAAAALTGISVQGKCDSKYVVEIAAEILAAIKAHEAEAKNEKA